LKRFLILGLAVIVVIGMMGAAFASFQDTGTSTGNTFTAGTLDLKLSDNNEYIPKDGVTASWTMSNMAPGLSSVLNGVSLINTGSLGSQVKISFSNTIQDTPDLASDTNWSSVPADMAKWLEITLMSYDGVTFLGAGASLGHKLIDTNS
jgi:spore coat-associated protein N